MCSDGTSARSQLTWNVASACATAPAAPSQLNAVLEAYARILHESHGHDDADLAAFLHRDEHLASANRRLREMLRELVSEAATAGNVRDDVPPDGLRPIACTP